jgi:Flp pilus assembly protein TadG
VTLIVCKRLNDRRRHCRVFALRFRTFLMSRNTHSHHWSFRRGAAARSVFGGLLLSLGLLVALTDVGLYSTARTGLQDAADAAALAAAVNLQRAEVRLGETAREAASAALADSGGLAGLECRIERGSWNARRRQFTPEAVPYNAARVTLSGKAAKGPAVQTAGWMISKLPVTPATTAVAALRPRDIVLVVDLSGAMNDDTEPCWAAAALDRLYPAAAGQRTRAGRGTQLVQRMYRDLGWGNYPGGEERLGEPWEVTDGPAAYAALAADAGPLAHPGVAPPYRIERSDDSAARKRKVYSAVIDRQLARLMPAAQPTPDRTASYEFWEQYLDYVLASSPAVVAGRSVAVPPDQSPYRITGFGNPDPLRFPLAYAPRAAAGGYPATACDPASFANRLGYATYLQFLLDHGRDLRPGGRTTSPYARSSPLCPTHAENTPAGEMAFLASEQPVHAVRRALVAAIHRIEQRNAEILDPALCDRVAVVTFDTLAGGARVAHPLGSDYRAAMQACTRLQSVGDKGPSSAMELGLQAALAELSGRRDQRRSVPADKLVVLVSGSPPDSYLTSDEQIDRASSETGGNIFYAGEAYPANAAIAQARRIAEAGGRLYPVGVGPRCAVDLLNRLARAGKTADAKGEAPRPPLDPAAYEARLVEQIVRALEEPSPRIVQ